MCFTAHQLYLNKAVEIVKELELGRKTVQGATQIPNYVLESAEGQMLKPRWLNPSL